MCLAVPVRIVVIENDKNEAEIEIAGVKRRISTMLTPEVKVGDYVLLHTGYSIKVIDETEAQETLKLFSEIMQSEST